MKFMRFSSKKNVHIVRIIRYIDIYFKFKISFFWLKFILLFESNNKVVRLVFNKIIILLNVGANTMIMEITQRN